MAASSARPSWITLEGVVLILLGALAICLPIMAGVALAFLIAWVLIVAGFIGLVSAFRARDSGHFGWSVASGAIALVVGLVLAINPLIGTAALSLFIAAYLLLDGITMLGLARRLQQRGVKGWGWRLAAGVLDILLSVYIIFMNAVGAAFLIGLVVGIDLIAAGVMILIIERAGRGTLAAQA
jgi:uncharacterized membrane protein HdeD (DUF308 family)